MHTLITMLMGLVEGITEFLPISSTGHLIIAGQLLHFKQVMGTEEAANMFMIVVQLGAILAVVVAYPRRFTGLLQFREKRGLRGLRGLMLLAITSVPAAVLGLTVHKHIEAALQKPLPVAGAFAVGAVWILIVEYWRPKASVASVDDLGWKHALGIGLFQSLSVLWPGMSRAASTILGGMMLGADRKTATEYSFFAAVPIMIAATGYEFLKHCKSLNAEQLELLAIGMVVAFVSAWVAVKMFIHFVSRHSLAPFAYYRLITAGLIFWMFRDELWQTLK